MRTAPKATITPQAPTLRGGAGYGGLACRQKGPARATKYFSGNGVAVAAMCAVRHQYRPVASNEGGARG